MAYSKAKLNSNGDRASPCFKPFLIGNMSDKFLPTRTLLRVSVRVAHYKGYITQLFELMYILKVFSFATYGVKHILKYEIQMKFL